jgi:hypothetical protein
MPWTEIYISREKQGYVYWIWLNIVALQRAINDHY